MAETTSDTTADLARAAAALGDTLEGIRRTARGIAGDLADGLKEAVVEGERLDDVIAGLATRLSDRFLDAALAPFERTVTQGLSGLVGGIAGGAGEAAGAAPDAAGAARAERGAGGVAVTLNVTTPDAEGFRRSEAQMTAMLARAVGRGRRGL